MSTMRMNSSITNSTSYSSFTSSMDSPTGGTTLHTQSLDTAVTIETSSSESDNQDGTVTLLGGEATAIGDHTAAIGMMEGQVTDFGGATLTEGSSSFVASSESSGDDTAYAYADSYAETSQANTLVTITSEGSETFQSTDYNTWTESSRTDLLALEIDASHLATDPGTTNVPESEENDEEPDGSTADDHPQQNDNQDDQIDGNLAMLTVDVVAYADDTVVFVDASALVIDDELSTISGSALFGVG